VLKTAMFITVGLSLYNNIWNHLQSRQVPSQDKPKCKRDLLYNIGDYYNLLQPDLLKELNCYENLRDIDFLSAEVESLCFWLDGVKDRGIQLERVFLLPTDTEESKKCAEQIKNIIVESVLPSRLFPENNSFDNLAKNVNIYPFKLNVENTTEFAQNVADFMAILDDKFAELDKLNIEYRVLDITGGYKVMVSIFSLFGFLRDDVEVIYKHEDATKFIIVPSLPLSWDLKLFDEYRTLIHEGHEPLNFKPPTKIAALFQRQHNNTWAKNAFGRVLEDIYDKNKFKRFGAGTRLMRYLKPGLQKEIEERISYWEHIWIGDQIPETVEHSRGHSVRLLEYASDLLGPQLQDDHKLLGDEELYLLICCLWLHDVGHTALKYELKLEGDRVITIPVSMFPTLVRRWHSILSHELIMNGDYLSKDEKYAVSMISKYHRGKFPLMETQGDWKDKQFNIVTIPMEKEISDSVTFRDIEVDRDKILLISALLKTIDGCDVQSDRIINDSYWFMRTSRTQAEVDYLFYLLTGKWDLLNLCGARFERRIKDLIKSLECCRSIWSEAQKDPKAGWARAKEVEKFVDEKIEPEIFDILKEAYLQCELDIEEKEILTEILSLLDRIAFKMIQGAHFYKHSRVKLVYITKENHHIQLNMVFDKSVEEYQKIELAKGIWDEYEAVKKILEKNNLEFEGVFSEGKKIYPKNGG
jgi:hypothetical protein